MEEIAASFIVPFYNSRATLGACLAALKLQDFPGETEILAVDDGSTDGSADLAQAVAGVKVLTQKNRGPAAARNLGAAQARGAILFFTDADCVPEPGWAAGLAVALENPNVSGAKGIYVTKQREMTARFVQTEYKTKYDYMRRFPFIDFIDTYAAAYRRQVFESERFDETFPQPSVEDQEFSFRLARAGHLFKFCPEARVSHRHAASPWSYFRKKMKIGFWKAKILVGARERFRGDTHTPLSLKLEMLLAPITIAGCLAAAMTSFQSLPAVFLALGASFAFLICNLPLFKEAARSDRALLPSVPFFALLRALGLGLGLGYGLALFGGRHLRQRMVTSFKIY